VKTTPNTLRNVAEPYGSLGSLHPVVRQDRDSFRQRCLEAHLERGDAWLCECGQINGYHNLLCCYCGEREHLPND